MSEKRLSEKVERKEGGGFECSINEGIEFAQVHRSVSEE